MLRIRVGFLSIACVTLVCKAADEIKKSFGKQGTKSVQLTSDKLRKNLAGLVTSGIGPDSARDPPSDHADINNHDK
jgi:hypothetical protein